MPWPWPARWLHKGCRVATTSRFSPRTGVEWAIVQMACAALGAVFVPLNTHYRKDDLAYALQQSDARALICSTAYRSNPYLDNVTALRPQLPLLRHVFTFEDDYPGLIAQRHGFTPQPSAPEDTAALLYTSGTTGFPKGALLSHRAMMMDARGAAARLGLRAGDRWTSIIPLFHCAGCILNLLGALQTGAAYVGVPSFDPEVMFRVIAGRALHPSVGRAHLLSCHARSSGAAQLRSVVAARRHLRRRGLQSGRAAALRRRFSDAGPLPGLWPDRRVDAVYLSVHGRSAALGDRGNGASGLRAPHRRSGDASAATGGTDRRVAGARADGDAGLLQEAGRDGGNHPRGRLAAQRRSRLSSPTQAISSSPADVSAT